MTGKKLATPGALTMRQAASRIISRHTRGLFGYERKARRGDDPEAIHQMRVNTRRLRAALAVFQGAIRPPKRARPRRIGWLSRRLGRVRDFDVVIALLEERHLPALSGAEAVLLEELLAAMKERRFAALAKLERAFKRPRYRKLRAALQAMAARPRFGGDEDATAARYLAEAIEREAAVVGAHAGMVDAEPEPEALHSLRIAAKRLRYALDFYGETCGIGYDAERRLARDIQEALGELHDHDLVLAWMEEAGRAGAPTQRRTGKDRRTEAQTHGRTVAVEAPVAIEFFAGPWPALEQRLRLDRGKLWRRFVRLRRQWRRRATTAPTVAPLEEPKFVALGHAPVQLKLVTPPAAVASMMIVR